MTLWLQRQGLRLLTRPFKFQSLREEKEVQKYVNTYPRSREVISAQQEVTSLKPGFNDNRFSDFKLFLMAFTLIIGMLFIY